MNGCGDPTNVIMPALVSLIFLWSSCVVSFFSIKIFLGPGIVWPWHKIWSHIDNRGADGGRQGVNTWEINSREVLYRVNSGCTNDCTTMTCFGRIVRNKLVGHTFIVCRGVICFFFSFQFFIENMEYFTDDYYRIGWKFLLWKSDSGQWNRGD